MRLMEQVLEMLPSDECVPWPGKRDRKGYGVATVNYKLRRAHRAIYERAVGPIPAGLQIDHTCHNRAPDCPRNADCTHRSCVNPAHMEPVTQAENLRRSPWRQAKAARTHCANGHEWTPENTYVYGDSNCRQCRACVRDAQRRRQQRLKEVHP